MEGSFLHPPPREATLLCFGGWRIHTNNALVGVYSPVPAHPPIRSETPPTLPDLNPFWQQISTGKLYFQHINADLEVDWREIAGTSEGVLPLVSDQPPTLPSDNPFWIKSDTDELHYQVFSSENVPSWKKASSSNRYDVSVGVGTVIDASLNQVHRVDNTTSSVKNISFTNLPADRAMQLVVVIEGKAGAVGYPAGCNLADGLSIGLSNTKTTLVFFWDGSGLIVTKGPSY